MPRISVPTIPDDLVNKLDTLESTLAWMRQLESVKKRLEKELQQINTVLTYVVYPRYNKLNKQDMIDERLHKGGK